MKKIHSGDEIDKGVMAIYEIGVSNS